VAPLPNGATTELTDTANLDGMHFALAGPMEITDCVHTPVRGDLAHIALAGRYFVPHYAVPMPCTVTKRGTRLMAGTRGEPIVLVKLGAGAVFNVLDISDDLAWGQCGEDGLVGYVAMDRLEPVR